MALNDYNYIEAKIRKLTARLSTNALSNDDLQEYIQSFVVYDLPLHTRFIYDMQIYTRNISANVFGFTIQSIKNTYSNFEPPAYIDNIPISYYQDNAAFNSLFTNYKYSVTLDTGTGVAGPYGGTYQYTPIEPDRVVISATTATGASVLALDDGVGGFVDETGTAIVGATINYATGVVAGITFTAVIPNGNAINISANTYPVGTPYAVLYFNNEFRFFPYPDKVYTFSINAYPNFNAYTAGAQFPELTQWADLISFGTSLKIFQDNLDLDSYQKVLPFFDSAQKLAGRRTLTQLTTQRVGTIYDSGGCYNNMGGFPRI